MSDGFGFVARVTESIWMLSYLMQICIKAAFTQTLNALLSPSFILITVCAPSYIAMTAFTKHSSTPAFLRY